MNDIPRNTSVARLMKSLLTPSHVAALASTHPTPDVVCGIIITNSRLDDELSVATVVFSDTPQWLQDLNRDPRGFPKSTTFGTMWRGVDRSATDTHGRTAFIDAVINGGSTAGMLYAEMLAEFSDTDVDVQDAQGRTALHWACIGNLPDMVGLCLSIADCTVGLKDREGLTAFDIALRTADESIPNLFYQSMYELEQTQPDAALLRVLTVTSEPATDRSLFPGEAIFNPILDRNGALVQALVDRGVDLTAINADGQTALHLAAGVGDVRVVEALLDAGSDVNAVGMHGATPLHCAAETGRVDVARLLLDYGADVGAEDGAGEIALQYAKRHGAGDVITLLKEVGDPQLMPGGVLDGGAELGTGTTTLPYVEEQEPQDVVVLPKGKEVATAVEYEAEVAEEDDVLAFVKASETDDQTGAEISLSEEHQSGNLDGQTAAVTGAEYIAVNNRPNIFGSQLASSCKKLALEAEWVLKVDEELEIIVSGIVDRISNLHPANWSGIYNEFNGDDNLERVGNDLKLEHSFGVSTASKVLSALLFMTRN